MGFTAHRYRKFDLEKQIEDITNTDTAEICFSTHAEAIESVNDEMILRGFSKYTHHSYISYTTDFLRYCNQPTSELGAAHIKKYLLHLLKERKLQNNTVNKVGCILKFLFNDVLHKNFPDSVFPSGHIKKKLPAILTVQGPGLPKLRPGATSALTAQ